MRKAGKQEKTPSKWPTAHNAINAHTHTHPHTHSHTPTHTHTHHVRAHTHTYTDIICVLIYLD